MGRITRLTSDNADTSTFTFSQWAWPNRYGGVVCDACAFRALFPDHRLDSRQQQGPAPAELPLSPRWAPAELPLSSPVSMELRTIVPAVLCISAACLQVACGAAPRRGPKVTEKVGANAALVCVNAPLHDFCMRCLLRTANGHTRARGESKRKGCCCFILLLLLSKREEWTSSRLDTDLSRTPSTPPARMHSRTLSCARYHSDAAAAASLAVHAQMRRPKENPFIVIIKTATGLFHKNSYITSLRNETNKRGGQNASRLWAFSLDTWDNLFCACPGIFWRHRGRSRGGSHRHRFVWRSGPTHCQQLCCPGNWGGSWIFIAYLWLEPGIYPVI